MSLTDLFCGKISKGFSVKASYKRIWEAHSSNWMVNAHRSIALNSLWKTKFLSKVLIFCSRLILNMLPTMMELARQGVLVGSHNLVCPLCFGGKEDLNNLFGEFPVSKLWWRKICDWLRVDCSNLTGSIINWLQALEMSCKSSFVIDT